jgi:hypothetical protein
MEKRKRVQNTIDWARRIHWGYTLLPTSWKAYIVALCLGVISSIAAASKQLPWHYVLIVALAVVAVVLTIWAILENRTARRQLQTEGRSDEAGGPRLVATRYQLTKDGPHKVGNEWYYSDGKKMTMQEILTGQHLKHGLWVENETDDSALEIGVGDTAIGSSATLKFHNYRMPRLTKAASPAFFEAWIQKSSGVTNFGGALRDIMVEENVAEVTVPVTYKDANEQWYLSPAKIERDHTGLSVRPMPRQKIPKP